MINNIKSFLNSRKGKVVSYLFLALFIFSLSYVTIQNKYDDFVFLKAIDDFGSFGKWLTFFAENWSGRLIPQGFMILILQCPEVVFHLINTVMWMVMLYYTAKDFDYYNVFDRRIVMIVVLASVYLLMPSGVIDGAISWKSANPLYLWGGALMLVALYPFICMFHEGEIRKRDICAALLSIVYVSGFEQAAVLMCGIMMVMMIYFFVRNRKVNMSCLVLFIVSLVLTVFFFFMPGNDARYLCEVLDNYEKYDMFSMFDRLLIGINYAISKAEKNVPHLLAAMSLIVLIVRIIKRERDFVTMTLAVVPFVYFSYCLTINSETLFSIIYRLVDVEAADFEYSVVYLVFELINVGMICMLGMNIAFIDRERFNPLLFSLFFGAFGSIAIMGFSPSIHMSGQRPRFLGYFCFICCILAGIIEIRNLLDKKVVKEQANRHSF